MGLQNRSRTFKPREQHEERRSEKVTSQHITYTIFLLKV